MKQWRDRLRFLWEEESVPNRAEVCPGPDTSAGVPRLLRRATRLALIGVVGSGVMGQVIGIRLVAPVDAAPAYRYQCQEDCRKAYLECLRQKGQQQKGWGSKDTCRRLMDTCERGCNRR